MSSTRFSCPILMVYVIFDRFSTKKTLKIKFYENSSSGSQGCSMWTDERDVWTDMTNLIVGN